MVPGRLHVYETIIYQKKKEHLTPSGTAVLMLIRAAMLMLIGAAHVNWAADAD